MSIISKEKAENPKRQVENLSLSIKEFISCIESLPDALFLKKMDDWAPRDVTAHLIGWDLYTIEGCQQIRSGETPFYFIDPGDDFCKINAVLVQKYNSTDKAELIKQLEISSEKLKQFILTLEPSIWDTDYGVTYKGEPVTVKNSIDMLIHDYANHRQQIEKWAESTSL
ncbi:ClbS/DfsB family four-helix bundle protein [Chloroflexota bacterium]